MGSLCNEDRFKCKGTLSRISQLRKDYASVFKKEDPEHREKVEWVMGIGL